MLVVLQCLVRVEWRGKKVLCAAHHHRAGSSYGGNKFCFCNGKSSSQPVIHTPPTLSSFLPPSADHFLHKLLRTYTLGSNLHPTLMRLDPSSSFIQRTLVSYHEQQRQCPFWRKSTTWWWWWPGSFLEFFQSLQWW